jgi:hypothetical protein
MANRPPSSESPGDGMELNLFDLLCEELGYPPSSVLVIRMNAREASVTYTEVSGMPRSTVHRIQRNILRATEDAA